MGEASCNICGGSGYVFSNSRRKRCACNPRKRWKPAPGTRWKNSKEQAKRLGFSTEWEMRKARAKEKQGHYVPSASAEMATPLLDRLEAGSGPVRHLPVDSWPILQVNKELRYCVPDTRHLAAVWQ